MKVLISRFSLEQVVGGAELSARDIARSLIKLGHESLLVTNVKKSIATRHVPKNKVAFVASAKSSDGTLSNIFYPLGLIRMFVQLFWIVIRFKPDILSPTSRDDQIILTAIGKIMHIPVVWRDPGDLIAQLQYPLSNVLQKINRKLQNWAIAHATHIFTLNNDDRKSILSLSERPQPNKLSVIGSNVMFDDYLVKPRRGQDQIVIGSVSRLDKHKGIQYLIEAFSQLQAMSDDKYKLIVAGDGSYRQELEKEAESTPGILFLGNQIDVSSVYNQLDIFVQPAEFEGWGRNIKEAMLFGLPIIGSDVGGIKKQLTDNKTGLLFEARDQKSLFNCLVRLTDSPALRHSLGHKARQKALADGDWVRTVEKEVLPLFERFL